MPAPAGALANTRLRRVCMPQLRIARATSPTDPAESSYAVFASNDAERGEGANWFIGRDRRCKVCVADASVSRQHLQVIYQGGSFHLRNVSQFGSEVDGKPLTTSDAPFPVRGNLSIKVGTIELRCTLIGDPNAMFGFSDAGDAPAAEPVANGNLWWISPAPSSSMTGGELLGAYIDVPSPEAQSADDWYLGEMMPLHAGDPLVHPIETIELWPTSRGDAAPAVEQSFDWSTLLPSSPPISSMADATPLSSHVKSNVAFLHSPSPGPLFASNGAKNGEDGDVSFGESNLGTTNSDRHRADSDNAKLVVQKVLQ